MKQNENKSVLLLTEIGTTNIEGRAFVAETLTSVPGRGRISPSLHVAMPSHRGDVSADWYRPGHHPLLMSTLPLNPNGSDFGKLFCTGTPTSKISWTQSWRPSWRHRPLQNIG